MKSEKKELRFKLRHQKFESLEDATCREWKAIELVNGKEKEVDIWVCWSPSHSAQGPDG